MQPNVTPLRFGEKLGYGLGDAASNFFFQVFNIFLLYYYTDVFGLDPAAVGTMFIVTKILDALSDPAMGLIADRTNCVPSATMVPNDLIHEERLLLLLN